MYIQGIRATSKKNISLIFIVMILAATSGCCGGSFVTTTATSTPIATAVSAQPTFNIEGFVRDYQGAPVSNANVRLMQDGVLVNMPENPRLSSDGRMEGAGEFSFKNVPAGQYMIIAEKDGRAGSITYSGSGPADIFLTGPSDPGQITPLPAQTSSDYYKRTYKWSYGGEWTTTVDVPVSLYDFYKGQPHDRQDNYAQYALSDYDRASMKSLVDMFEKSGEKYGHTEYDDVLSVVSFVQALPYTSDEVTTGYDEYPRYPIETLVDDGGDCEDTAILTAALLHEMGYGVVLFELPGHVAVGVKCSDDYPGSYVEYRGSKYYYLETTGESWKIGQIPDEYKDKKMTVYPLIQMPQMDLTFNATFEDSDLMYAYYRVHCNITNIGSGTARNVSAYFAALALSQGEDRVWDPDHTAAIGDVAEGSTGWAEVTLRIPRNENTQIECALYGDNFEPVIMKTKLFST